ncbi:MAG: trans-aconitate 2-methyltransferase [Steroidobacteraceae bacterium]
MNNRLSEWSARRYANFEVERTRPATDLLAAVAPVQEREIIDLGCGPGNSTELLAKRFPSAAIRGLDRSADMVAAARARLPRLNFEIADIADWAVATRGQFDVIFANAVLHWVPDHGRLFPALQAKLAPGGSLAVQMPDNLNDPAHRLMREIANEGPWRERCADAHSTRTAIADAQWYYELLKPGAFKIDIWRTTYFHALPGGSVGILDWFKGSGLRPYLACLDEAECAEFESRYESALGRAYPSRSDGTVLLPFERIFIVASGR